MEKRPVCDGGGPGDRVTFLEAWLIDSEKPIRPLQERNLPPDLSSTGLCGICGVDDDVMELENEEGDAEKESDSFTIGEEVFKKSRDDDREIKRMIDPRRPTKAEVDDHDLFHLPYRSWYPICVRAKGKELDHRKSLQKVLKAYRSTPLIIAFLEMNLGLS